MPVTYRRLLADRPFTIGIGAVALSAVALGMIPLTLVLNAPVRSLATGAIAAGAFGVGNALGVPAQGALMARVPARLVLITSATVSCCFLVAAVIIAGRTVSPMLLAGAGLSFPALAAAFRASIPVSFADEADRSGGYALLSVAFQAGLATGPVAAGVLAASSLRPFALLAAAAMMTPASLLLSVPRRAPRASRQLREQTGTIAQVMVFVRIIAVAGLASVASGSLTVIVPAMIGAPGTAGLAGIVLSCSALGEAAGALVFGARRGSGSRTAPLLVALSLATGAYAVLPITGGQVLPLAIVVFILGAVSSPVTIILSTTLDDVVPPPLIASAYGVLVTTAVGCAALGTSGAGLLIGATGSALGGSTMAVAALTAATALSLRPFVRRAVPR